MLKRREKLDGWYCCSAVALIVVSQLLCLVHFHNPAHTSEAKQCALCLLQHESFEAPDAAPAAPAIDIAIDWQIAPPAAPARVEYARAHNLRAPPAAESV